MAPKHNTVIVFGPTGTVGGYTALAASALGAHVYLAMRDPTKPIPAIPAETETTRPFTRIQADLTSAPSVSAAIAQSGARAAYIYATHDSPDHMRGTLQAMRDAGVEHLVLLSSATVGPGVAEDLRAVPEGEFIAYLHARAEVAVEDVGFPWVTALRPSVFASNYLRLQLDRGAVPPRANVLYLDGLADNIVPEDIGAVGGAVLVGGRGRAEGKEVIYLCGPEVKTVGEVWGIIKRVTGREDIDTTPVSAEGYLQGELKRGAPPPVAEYMVKFAESSRDRERIYPDSIYVPAAANVKKYTGREPTRFEDYIEAHKAEWQAI